MDIEEIQGGGFSYPRTGARLLLGADPSEVAGMGGGSEQGDPSGGGVGSDDTGLPGGSLDVSDPGAGVGGAAGGGAAGSGAVGRPTPADPNQAGRSYLVTSWAAMPTFPVPPSRAGISRMASCSPRKGRRPEGGRGDGPPRARLEPARLSPGRRGRIILTEMGSGPSTRRAASWETTRRSSPLPRSLWPPASRTSSDRDAATRPGPPGERTGVAPGPAQEHRPARP